MIPSVFVFLDAFPRTPTGKVDHRAFPAPGGSRPDLDTAFVAARSPVEDVLAGIWGEVLGLDRVGIHDRFLDLGGHSLQAMRILTRAITTFRVDLPLRELLEAPTVAAMAARLVQWQAQAVEDAEVARMLAELEALSEDEAQRKLAPEPIADRRAGDTP
jgi:acyl carrier protein